MPLVRRIQLSNIISCTSSLIDTITNRSNRPSRNRNSNRQFWSDSSSTAYDTSSSSSSLHELTEQYASVQPPITLSSFRLHCSIRSTWRVSVISKFELSSWSPTPLFFCGRYSQVALQIRRPIISSAADRVKYCNI